MLPVTKNEEIVVIPEGFSADDAKAPKYILGVPSQAGRIAWQKAISNHGLRFPDDEEGEEMMLEAVKKCIPASQQADLTAIITRFFENIQDAPQELKEEMAKLEMKLAGRYPQLNQLFLLRQEYMNLSMLLAAKFFLLRTENAPAVERSGGEVTDATFSAQNDAHMIQVGLKAMTYTKLDKEAEKN